MPKKKDLIEESLTLPETEPLNIYSFVDRVATAISKIITSVQKVSPSVNVSDDVYQILRTVAVICSLDKYDGQVIDERGFTHSIEEYEIGGQFESLVTPRGIAIDDSEEALDLRVFEFTKNYAVCEPDIISDGLDKDTLNLIESFTKYEQCKFVPLAPGEFRAAQVRVVNVMKGKVERWTSIKELSNPTTFNTIKVFLDIQSETVSLPSGEIATLPIPVTIFRKVYPAYKCAMPLDEYLDKFAFSFVNGLA